MPENEIGVVGLATMGMNLARNLASHGVRVAVFNRTRARTDEFMQQFGRDGDFKPAYSFQDLANALKPPRAVLLMVKAGAPVDDAIDALTGVLGAGDTIIDGGNSFFQDTQRRAAALEQKGFGFIGSGVSGGEEGALHGPSLMPGGTRESYDRVEEILTAIAAKVDGAPCCTYIGPDGAGHFVKMVHNGIEYADIQLIAESYDLLRHGLNLPADELAAVFRRWNDGRLQSYLVEITSQVLAKHDGGSSTARVDAIEDEAEQKGTGRCTTQSAPELAALASSWRGGCIIRAKFLDRINEAYADSPDLPSLMLAPFFQQALAEAQPAWRRVVKTAVDNGIPIPAFASSLSYYDGYRRARGPAGLIQALRDYFGAHTYHRVDREGVYHTRWGQDGAEVRTG